jgi:hypothetical protein
VNKIAPNDVIISPTGRYIVTFDNWDWLGWGKQVIVIYEDGNLIHNLNLTDILTEKELFKIPSNLTGRKWSTRNHSFNKDETLLLLNTVRGQKNIEIKTEKLLNEDGSLVQLSKIKIDMIVDLTSIWSTRQVIEICETIESKYSHGFSNCYFGNNTIAEERSKLFINFHGPKALWDELCAELTKWPVKYEYHILF